PLTIELPDQRHANPRPGNDGPPAAYARCLVDIPVINLAHARSLSDPQVVSVDSNGSCKCETVSTRRAGAAASLLRRQLTTKWGVRAGGSKSVNDRHTAVPKSGKQRGGNQVGSRSGIAAVAVGTQPTVERIQLFLGVPRPGAGRFQDSLCAAR